jgi:hypothetical protein
MAVTAVPSVSQWAEMERIAFGRGSERASAFQPRVKAFSSNAFSGEPWPMKITGIRVPMEGEGFTVMGISVSGRVSLPRRFSITSM